MAASNHSRNYTSLTDMTWRCSRVNYSDRLEAEVALSGAYKFSNGEVEHIKEVWATIDYG